MSENNPVLVKIKNLYKYFPLNRNIIDILKRKPQKYIKAVDNISLDIKKNETLALVGESGCGKSTLARTIIRLYNADSGEIIFRGEDFRNLNSADLKQARKKIQMVFQDPYSSLNPKITIGNMLKEILQYHNICAPTKISQQIEELLSMVSINKDAINRYPYSFSGGQAQRLGIARALAVKPELIIADEITSALDVSIQAQIINLLLDLRDKYGLSILFISHDLRVVYYLADRVAVMYLGKIIELGDKNDIYTNPLHPYTKLLLSSVPGNINLTNTNISIENAPSPIDIPAGCRFVLRCPYAKSICHDQEPTLNLISKNHFCACYLFS